MQKLNKEFHLKLTHIINIGSLTLKKHSIKVNCLSEALLLREALADCMLLFSDNIVDNLFILRAGCEEDYTDFMDQDGNTFDDYILVDGKAVLNEDLCTK